MAIPYGCSWRPFQRTDESSSILRITRHLEHRPPEARASEKALRGLVTLCRPEHDLWPPSGLERRQRRIEQRLTDAVPAMGWIDDDVVQDTGRSAQRHVVAPLDTCIAVSDHPAALLADEDDDVWNPELRL